MWLIFAILAPVFWGFSNPVDSVLRRHFIKNDFVLTCLLALTKLPLVLLLLVIFAGDLTLSWPVFGMFFAGVLWTLPFVLYFKSLEREETSRVILMIQFQPVFVLILAALILNEILVLSQLAAFVLILAGSILAAIKKTETRWHFSKVFFFMLLASLGWSLADVLFKKFVVYFPNFWSAFAVDVLGSSFPALFIFLLSRYRKIVSELKSLPVYAWKFFTAAAVLSTFGSLCFAYALTLGKAALTIVISGFQPLFAMFFGWLLSRFFREISRESLSRVDLLLKGASFVLMTVGLVSLYL